MKQLLIVRGEAPSSRPSNTKNVRHICSERRRLATVTCVCIHPPQTLAVFARQQQRVGEEIAGDSLAAAPVTAAMFAAPQKG